MSNIVFDEWLQTTGQKCNAVIQAVVGTTTAQLSSASESWVNTNLFVAITPESVNSSILILVNDLAITNTPTNYYESGFTYGIWRDGVTDPLTAGVYVAWTGQASTYPKGKTSGIHMIAFDKPATTSAVTYRTKIACDIPSSTVYAHRITPYNSTPGSLIGVPQIIALEIQT